MSHFVKAACCVQSLSCLHLMLVQALGIACLLAEQTCVSLYSIVASMRETRLSVIAVLQGDLAYLFILSANDKQWSKSKSTLKKLVETFHV